MDAEELAVLISQALEDDVNIDVKPKSEEGFASLLCDDEDGNHYSIQIHRLGADGNPEVEADYLGGDRD